jgi:hypothetical protein
MLELCVTNNVFQPPGEYLSVQKLIFHPQEGALVTEKRVVSVAQFLQHRKN